MSQTCLWLPLLFPLKISSRSAPVLSILLLPWKKNAMMSPPQIKLSDPKVHVWGWGGSQKIEGQRATTSKQETELDGKTSDDNT